MSSFSKMFLSFIGGFLLGIVLISFAVKHSKVNIINKTIIDTTYNHVVLDSIKYRIIYRDSIINNIKVKRDEKVEEVKHYTDSASIELFYKLLSK